MNYPNYPSFLGEQLSNLIQTVRRQRNLLFWLRGLAITVTVSAGLLLLAGWAAYKQRFNTGALISLRLVALAALLATIYFALVRPLRRRVSDAQLAHLIEEKNPGLNDRLVSAVEFADDEQRALTSNAIYDRLTEDANQKAAAVDLDAVVPRKRVWQYGSTALASVALFIAVLVFGPQEIRHGLIIATGPSTQAAETNALQITVKPGTARVPKGSDQKITATTVNFVAAQATIFLRKAGAGDDQWAGLQMEPAKEKDAFQHFIFNIQEDTEYFVEASGCRSQIFKLTVADLPFVKRIDLRYEFPAYTGLPSKTVEDTGEIAALAGTNVRVMARLTNQAKAARIVLRDGAKIEMQRENTEDGALIFAASLTVNKESSYHIELVSTYNDVYNGSNEYDITVLDDHPPTVSFEKPGRDMRATSVEEVFAQAKAEDDYGVTALEMFISVNGGEEKKVDLQRLKSEAARSLAGAYTFFLEEYGLQPGDFISYYAKARDAKNETTSDIYFIEVKPFEKDYKQSQQAGGGGGGGGGDSQNALSKRQKDLIAATFRVIRDEATYEEKEKTENYNTIALGQEKLRDDTNQLIDRIKRRLGTGLQQNQDFAKLVEHLTQAGKEMESALPELKNRKGKEGLPPEQRALQQLLRADAIFREIQVSQNQEGQGQGSQRAEDLADLFELEMDKMKNQYETVKREQQQQGQQEDDETKRKLEELARRQQKELEQQRQRAQQGARNQQSGGGGGGGRQQQQLIDEARKLARELERLSRERRQPQLQELSRKLDQAADEMQKAQANNSNSQESLAQGLRALEKIEEARRQLDRMQAGQGGKSLKDLQQRAADAAARQRDISKDTEDLAQRNRNGQAASAESKQRMGERKDALANEISNLEKDIDQTARGLGQQQQAAADKLRQAANELRGNRVQDRIRATKQLLDNNFLEAASRGDKIIQENLDQLAQSLQEAEKNAGKRAGGDPAEENLERARQLADNVDQMRRQLADRNGSQAGNQNDRNQQGNRQGNQQGNQQGSQPNQQAQNQAGQGQQSGNQQNQQAGNQSAQQNNQQGNQPGQGRQQGNQQLAQNQQGRGQQQGGRQQGNQSQQSGQQSGQQGGQQGQQQSGQQGGQQGQQQSSQQGGQQSGGSQAGGQQDNRGQGGNPQNNDRQGGQPNQQNPQFPLGGGPIRGGTPMGERRQTEAELRERLREAQELRRSLGGDRQLTRDLDQAIEGLRRATEALVRDDLETANLLKTQVVDPLRSIETELSKRLQAKLGRNNLRLADEGEAPERYRKLVGEYYKRLSSGTKQ